MLLTMTKPRCLCLMGTRPEVIKMSPVINALRSAQFVDTTAITVGQHTDLLDTALHDFDLRADQHIRLDRARGSSNEVFAQALDRIDVVLAESDFRFVVAQGDTMTVTASAIAAFNRRVPFVHIEAGLRTGDLAAPFPEEFNRRTISLAATLHCAPTQRAIENLLREGVPAEACALTGNTVIDALMAIANRLPETPPAFPRDGLYIIQRKQPVH